MRRAAKAASAAVVLLALGGGGAAFYRHKHARKSDQKTVAVERKSIAHTLRLTGKVIPVTSLVVTPRQSGRIVAVAVEEGAQVKEGDRLFSMRLEASGQTELLAQRSEVKRLGIEVESAAARLKEKQPVRELIGSASVLKEENELEKSRIELQAARDRLAVLEDDLGLAKAPDKAPDKSAKGAKGKSAATAAGAGGIVFVNATQTGIVTLIDKRPGDFVWGGGGGTSDASSANDRMVMTIADMSSLTVRTRVLEADLRYVQKNLPVNVKLDAYPDAKYTGVVTHIGGQGRTDAKAGYTYFDVDVSVDQKDGRVLPEMNATIELIFAKKDDALTLPLSAVAIFPDKAVVRQADDSELGYAEKTVTVGIVNETDAEIVSGLAQGEKVLEIDFATFQLDDKDDEPGKGGRPPKKGRS